jgi:hypothetical protein
MFEGIKAFQKDAGEKVDGVMHPEGPTLAAMNDQMAQRSESGGGWRGGNEPKSDLNCNACPTPSGWKRTAPATAKDPEGKVYYCRKSSADASNHSCKWSYSGLTSPYGKPW